MSAERSCFFTFPFKFSLQLTFLKDQAKIPYQDSCFSFSALDLSSNAWTTILRQLLNF
jgi:hypothetical protein